MPLNPLAYNTHGNPADHDADGRGERDPIIGEEGVEGMQFVGALCGWGRELIGHKTLVETQRLIRKTG